jgi:hypothetical protein
MFWIGLLITGLAVSATATGEERAGIPWPSVSPPVAAPPAVTSPQGATLPSPQDPAAEPGSDGSAAMPGQPGPAGPSAGTDAGAPSALDRLTNPFASSGAGGEDSDFLASANGQRSFSDGVLLPPVIGDLSPFLPAPFRLSAVNQGATANPTSFRPGSSQIYQLAGIKIADNQTPAPQDRLFFSFNYFNNVNAAINKRLGGTISDVNLFQNIFGFEKTAFDGWASIGIKLPLDHASLQTSYQGFPKQSSSVGNVSVYVKALAFQDARTGNFASVGLDVTTPTGPGGFAGSKLLRAANPATLQPFVGYYASRGRFFVQGFSSIDVPTAPRSVATVIYNDLCAGYYLYRAPDSGRFLTAVIPVFETHVNTPVSYAGYNIKDPRGVPDMVDLTFGTHFQIRERSLLTLSYVDPVTGPRPFSGEFALLFNYLYGGRRTPSGLIPPPVQ